MTEPAGAAHELLILGPGHRFSPGKIAQLPKSTTILALGLQVDDLRRLGIASSAVTHGPASPAWIAEFHPIFTAGISNAENYWRTQPVVTAFNIPGCKERGFLVVRQIAGHPIVFCQAGPWLIDLKHKPYLRTTQRRQFYLVNRLLHNLGARSTSVLRQRLAKPHLPHVIELPPKWEGLADPDDRGMAEKWFQPNASIHRRDGWQTLRVPGMFDQQIPELKDYDGLFWYRVSWTIPQAYRGLPLTLELGGIDDESWTWLNGHFLGEITKKTNPKDYWSAPRRYRLDPDQVYFDRPNILIIRVRDTYKNGGITGIPRVTTTPPWLNTYYRQQPVKDDDPYRYYRW